MSLYTETKPRDKPKISIGMPLYNAEQFLRNRLDNILPQTFTDFELIVSDNASTDSTWSICEEYSRKDERIRCIHQEQNMGSVWNFYFVLQEAKYDYFVWASADDKWNSDFLEKNIKILESHKNVVGSTSKVERYGPPINEFKSNPKDSIIIKFYKRIRRHFRPFGTYPAFGSWEKKAGFYLRHSSGQSIYAVFRTDPLRKSIIPKTIGSIELAIILNVLKFGDFYVIDEVLWYYYTGGISSKVNFDKSNPPQLRVQTISFPISFSFWCKRNFGIKFFIKNLDCFIWMDCWGVISFLIDFILLFKYKIT